MRLGKEQAVGYVEDTEVDSLSAQEPTIGRLDETSPQAAAEAPLTVS